MKGCITISLAIVGIPSVSVEREFVRILYFVIGKVGFRNHDELPFNWVNMIRTNKGIVLRLNPKPMTNH